MDPAEEGAVEVAAVGRAGLDETAAAARDGGPVVGTAFGGEEGEEDEEVKATAAGEGPIENEVGGACGRRAGEDL